MISLRRTAVRALLFALLGLAIPALPASADLVTWEFSGQVTTAEPTPLSSLFPAGTDVVFRVTVDTAAADSCVDPGSGFYSMPGSTLGSGGQAWASQSTSLEVHNPMGNCVSGITQDSTFRLVDFGAAPFSSASIGWFDPQPGDGIPALPSADTAYFFISYVGMSPTVWGQFDSVRVVPEPHVMTLLAVAGLALTRRRRR